MSLELTINTDFLQSLDPPSSFPPREEQLIIQIENKFLAECERFISNEKMLYKCSKSIENRLKNILTNSENIKQTLVDHKDKFVYITRELQKYKHQRESLREKQRILKMLCDLIKMEEVRKDLLLTADKQSDKMQIINQDEYLSKLQKLASTIEQASQLSNFSQQFPLIKDITNQLDSIFTQALLHLQKQLLTPKMIELSLNKYKHIFFGSKPNPTFLQTLTRNRIQHIKISLNPMINNLNYASNIPELYQAILNHWTEMLTKQIQLFRESQQFQVVRKANQYIMGELIPKMQKNLFRIKDLVQVVRIRYYFHKFQKALNNIQQLQKETSQTPNYVSSLISKSQAIIQSQLTQQSQQLQNSKYNIYTLVSYIPIREHLQKMEGCYQYSLEKEQIDWEVAFYNLFSSRDPKNYPNNKSLVIFNLNIWYLYLKLIPQGKYRKEGQELMQWCKNTFTTINVQQTNKKYFQSFQKILQMGGNITAFKNTLYSQIQLLGHEQLRRDIAAAIRSNYLSGYENILGKIDKKPMTNQEVKEFCLNKKINLNKFGKFSQAVCILSKEELQNELAYQ